MLLGGDEISKFIKNFDSRQIQPSGVDLTVEKIYKIQGPGKLTKEQIELPEYTELKPLEGKWHLPAGSYIISYEQIIKIPEKTAGLVLPRSSLMRMGAMIFTALWDPGYEGKGSSLLYVFNNEGVVIEKGARIAQLIVIKAQTEKKYSGRYQYEGLKKI